MGAPTGAPPRAPGAGAHAETAAPAAALERGRSRAAARPRWDFSRSGFGKGAFPETRSRKACKRVMKGLGKPTLICVNAVGVFLGGYNLIFVLFEINDCSLDLIRSLLKKMEGLLLLIVSFHNGYFGRLFFLSVP